MTKLCSSRLDWRLFSHNRDHSTGLGRPQTDRNHLAAPVAALLVLAATLTGCVTSTSSSSKSNKPYYADDRPPERPFDASAVPDAVPRVEKITRAGNKNPYTVLRGTKHEQTIHLLPSNTGYKKQGVASWYGTQFHGNPTSNGEKYDMFAMTAAHKTLRIPCYVRVTNLDNGRQVIVRVNDRGPFLHDRIIDLSYAAAQKLGYADRGTGRVEVEVIDPVAFHQQQKQPKKAGIAKGSYLQVGAFSSSDSARAMQHRVKQHVAQPVVIQNVSKGTATLFKVLIGPVTVAQQQQLRQLLNEREQLSPFLIHI